MGDSISYGNSTQANQPNSESTGTPDSESLTLIRDLVNQRREDSISHGYAGQAINGSIMRPANKKFDFFKNFSSQPGGKYQTLVQFKLSKDFLQCREAVR